MQYFGSGGDRLQMMLNFWVNQRIFYTLATGNADPLRKALLDTYERPHASQWGVFLRAHDELDLGRLTDRQREQVFAEFAPRSTCCSTTAASAAASRRC
jgi:maltose alpha-D-glucosyltransferase/alpha-amylase